MSSWPLWAARQGAARAVGNRCGHGWRSHTKGAKRCGTLVGSACRRNSARQVVNREAQSWPPTRAVFLCTRGFGSCEQSVIGDNVRNPGLQTNSQDEPLTGRSSSTSAAAALGTAGVLCLPTGSRAVLLSSHHRQNSVATKTRHGSATRPACGARRQAPHVTPLVQKVMLSPGRRVELCTTQQAHRIIGITLRVAPGDAGKTSNAEAEQCGPYRHCSQVGDWNCVQHNRRNIEAASQPSTMKSSW